MITFGPFQLDESRRELRCGAQPVKLEKIPFEILLLLIRERERVVAREEIAETVWGRERYVEAADGINTAVRKIRRALDDNADEPRYIQTLVGRGYRFIAPAAGVEVAAAPVEAPVLAAGRWPRWQLLVAGALVCTVLLGWAAVSLPRPRVPSPAVRLARLSSDPGFTAWPDISPDGKMLAYASNRADPDNLDIYIQPVDGNQAIRLTQDPARDMAPAISPVGNEVAFESHREPAGVYVVPLLGGEARLLAKDGLRPRYSPDGRWIAYYTAEIAATGSSLQVLSPLGWKSWVVPASGGTPQPVHAGFISGKPVWAGNDFLILTGGASLGAMDWWVTPRDGSWKKPLGVYAALSKNIEDISSGWNEWAPSYFENGSIVFSARTRDGANLWRLRVSEDWKPAFPPERMTMMNDHVRDASASANGRIAATVVSRNNDVYEIPVDTNAGVVKGGLRRLTEAKTSEQFVTVSADANLVVYTSWRGGADAGDIYAWDRRTGKERQLTATPDWESFPRMSLDGNAVFYKWFQFPKKMETRRVQVATGEVDTVCENCTYMDQTADGKSFVYGDPPGKRIFVKDFAGGIITEPVQGDSIGLTNASLDSANLWMAFVGAVAGEKEFRIYVAPYRRDAKLPRRDWVEIGKGMTPMWSPNGEWIYFDEMHDAYRCIWSRRFDRATGRPVGEKVAIAHLHGDKHLISVRNHKDRGVTRDRILFSLNEETANIWLMR